MVNKANDVATINGVAVVDIRVKAAIVYAGNEHVRRLNSILASTDTDSQRVAYLAIGDVIARKMMSCCNDEIDMNNEIKNIINYLNEIVTVNVQTLISTTYKFREWYVNRHKFPDDRIQMTSWTGFLDVLGVTKYFSTDDMFLINRNIDRFMDVYVTSAQLIDMLHEKMKKC